MLGPLLPATSLLEGTVLNHHAEPMDFLTILSAFTLQGSGLRWHGSRAPGFNPSMHADALYQPIAWPTPYAAADTER